MTDELTPEEREVVEEDWQRIARAAQVFCKAQFLDQGRGWIKACRDLVKLLAERTLALRAFLAARDAAAKCDPLDKRMWSILADQFNAAAKQAHMALRECTCGEGLKALEGGLWLCEACGAAYHPDGRRLAGPPPAGKPTRPKFPNEL